MADGSSVADKVISGANSLIEKATELRFFLLLCSFILLLDSCLVFFYEKNLLSAFRAPTTADVSVGGAIVFVALFAFLMSVFFRGLRYAIQLGFALAVSRIDWLQRRERDELGRAYKYPTLALAKAIVEKDSFTYSRIQEHLHAQESSEATLTIGFGMALLFLGNNFVLGSESVQTISQVFASFLAVDHGFWVNRIANAVMGSFLILVVVLFMLALRRTDEAKVYLPDAPENYSKPSEPTDITSTASAQRSSG